MYLYKPDSYPPLARVDQTEGEEQRLYYYHTDQFGKPQELTDSDGKIALQAKYRSWGSVEQLTVNEVEQNLRFQGQYFDTETGLHYSTFWVYDIFHEKTLASSEFKLNDAAHFSLANQSVHERMNVDADFKAAIEAKYPGIIKHVQPRVDGGFTGGTSETNLASW